MRYFIVDDDAASRRMLKQIILEGDMGVIVGEADSGISAIESILSSDPDFVLIDLLMPNLDGIETIEQLRKQGFKGYFIMISQVENKEMVGHAYEKDIEFFIHKPINKIEVQSILKKTSERFLLKKSLLTIRKSLLNFEAETREESHRTIKDVVFSILNDMGIVGEAGSDDIVAIIEFLVSREDKPRQIPPLKDLYEELACRKKLSSSEIIKESKAIEQRIRRTLVIAMNNLATLGVVDYTNPEFEYYAPRYFEFAEIRGLMNGIQQKALTPKKMKVNVKKFLQVLYVDAEEKFKHPPRYDA
ncbi:MULTISPECIES: response regulator [Rummeliibacillus]|uniref:Histidine kinase n=1 Tax=Rummeliibacillus stabekisii TaxID=241244 RepID=A0A143HFQ2_9BACL|nr:MULTISPECIES: response regulator [Rummeliibacillus]AMX00545.1 histidine kinase [Rummeliibacillus stabekisii]MBB5171232.1 two-component system response regulator YcbB [Rummeliibacillus stabekisii]GEL06065.1 transcriptional regulatory protein GlnL [Rummeliibacillus stabekisii]